MIPHGPHRLECRACHEPGVLTFYSAPEPSNGYGGGWQLEADECESCGAEVWLEKDPGCAWPKIEAASCVECGTYLGRAGAPVFWFYADSICLPCAEKLEPCARCGELWFPHDEPVCGDCMGALEDEEDRDQRAYEAEVDRRLSEWKEGGRVGLPRPIAARGGLR